MCDILPEEKIVEFDRRNTLIGRFNCGLQCVTQSGDGEDSTSRSLQLPVRQFGSCMEYDDLCFQLVWTM
jgi:hypothetical protein